MYFNNDFQSPTIKMLNSYINSEFCQLYLPDEKKYFDFCAYHKIDGILLDYIKPNSAFLTEEIQHCKLFYQKRNSKMRETAYNIAYILNRNNIPFVFLKGIVLEKALYKQSYHRYYNDIDILVDEPDLSKVYNILISLGYIQGRFNKKCIERASRQDILFQRMFTHEIYNFVKINKWGVSNIDVNFKFSWVGLKNDYEPAESIPFEIIHKNTEVFSKNFYFLNNDLQLIHLCCHLYNEAMFWGLNNSYSKGDPRELPLIRLLDISLLVKQTEINWDHVNALAQKYKVAYKLKYVNDLFCSLKLDCRIKMDFRTLDNRLNYYYTKNGDRKEWQISTQTRLFNIEKKGEYFLNSKN